MQGHLFDTGVRLPEGLRYEPEFLSIGDEQTLLQTIGALPFSDAQYKQFTARRRIVSFGGRYDFSSNELLPAAPVPPWLYPLRERAAAWAQLPEGELNHALIAEYMPGTPLGWHRDVPDFESIVGISLAGKCRMRFRRYPPRRPGRAECHLDLLPRSIYTMQGPARWAWQHSVSPTKELRYSITFRTMRNGSSEM
jgi:alkylated DNA repair dioxygenase AlkB